MGKGVFNELVQIIRTINDHLASLDEILNDKIKLELKHTQIKGDFESLKIKRDEETRKEKDCLDIHNKIEELIKIYKTTCNQVSEYLKGFELEFENGYITYDEEWGAIVIYTYDDNKKETCMNHMKLKIRENKLYF